MEQKQRGPARACVFGQPSNSPTPRKTPVNHHPGSVGIPPIHPSQWPSQWPSQKPKPKPKYRHQWGTPTPYKAPKKGSNNRPSWMSGNNNMQGIYKSKYAG